jgi:hypothetical protein
MLSRRQFSASLAPVAAAAAPQTPARRRALKQFKEVAASLYAWDLQDEGVEGPLETLRETAGATSTYLVALMHHEKRPLTDFFYPHNPRRKTYFPEDSRAFWQPRLDMYKDTKIKPLTSTRPELKGVDWLQRLLTTARNGKWKTGAEISHTVLDMERARGEHVDVVQRDIFGNPIGQLICPNNEHARNYLIALFSDLVKNYDVDFVQTCLVPFAAAPPRAMVGIGDESHAAGTFGFATWGSGGGANLPERTILVTLGGCFCINCEAAGKKEGFDLKAARKAMMPVAAMLDHPGPAEGHKMALLRASNTTGTGLLLRHPEIFDWMKFRKNSMTRLFRDVHAAITRIKPAIDLRLNAFIYDNWELTGLDFAALKPYLGSIRSSNYDEQSGRMEQMEHKRRFLLSVREAIGDDMHFLSSIGIRPRATPELVRKGVIISSECGADGLSLGHYDGAPLRNLEAIRLGMQDADVTIG